MTVRSHATLAIANILLCLFSVPASDAKQAPRSNQVRLDHVYVIVLENQSFDEALFGPTPFIRHLAQTQGLATYYFGITHPSLPNYLAMIAGDDFGIRENRPSCFASDLRPQQPCHAPDAENLADQLEARNLTWSVNAEDLPAQGSLVAEFPTGEAQALYVQKHNPFAYFKAIATNKTRLQHIKPLTMLEQDISTRAPNFAMIIPNQCNDRHGLAICSDPTDLARRSDGFLERTVGAIRSSKGWTDKSAIIITFDEGAPPRGLSGSPRFSDCCGTKSETEGGHHLATIVVTKCGTPVRSARALDHYSLLATIEDGFGLKRLRKAAQAETMQDLIGKPCR